MRQRTTQPAQVFGMASHPNCLVRDGPIACRRFLEVRQRRHAPTRRPCGGRGLPDRPGGWLRFSGLAARRRQSCACWPGIPPARPCASSRRAQHSRQTAKTYFAGLTDGRFFAVQSVSSKSSVASPPPNKPRRANVTTKKSDDTMWPKRVQQFREQLGRSSREKRPSNASAANPSPRLAKRPALQDRASAPLIEERAGVIAARSRNWPSCVGNSRMPTG